MKQIHLDSDGDTVITTNEELQKSMSEFNYTTEKELQELFLCTYGIALVIDIK